MLIVAATISAVSMTDGMDRLATDTRAISVLGAVTLRAAVRHAADRCKTVPNVRP